MINEIANKSGIYYSKVNEDLLITGDIYSYFDGREVYNGFISKGYKVGKWIDYYINGSRRGEFMYKNGLMKRLNAYNNGEGTFGLRFWTGTVEELIEKNTAEGKSTKYDVVL